MFEFTRSPRFFVLLFAAMLASAGATAGGGLALEPSAACQLLSAQGLGARGGYRSLGDVYECRSRRRPLIGGGQPNNSLQFSARGTADVVDSAMLELRVNSRSAVQRAHRQLLEAAQLLSKGAVGQTLPAEAEAGILSAVRGSWSVDGHTLTLDRVVSGGPGYELRLRLE
jgi:hypothetical protein